MKDLISGLICLILGVWIWTYSGSFPELEQGYPGPALFPRLIGGALAAAGLSLSIQASRRFDSWGRVRGRFERAREAFVGEGKLGLGRLALGSLVVIAYPWIQPFTGTILAIAVVCAAFGFLLDVRARVAVPTAVVSGVVIYLVFNELLGVPL